MKATRISLMTILTAGIMLAISPALLAQDKPADKPGDKPAQPEGRSGGPGGQRGGDFLKRRLDRMTEELKLTDAQKPKVEAALKVTGEKMRALSQDERREKGKAIREEEAKTMKGILDTDQFAKYEKMAQQRGPGGPGGPGRPPGGPDGGKKPEAEKKPASDNK